MDKFKRIMGDGLQKLKKSASQLVSNRGESEEEDYFVVLDEPVFEHIRRKAEQENMPIDLMVNQMLKQQIQKKLPNTELYITAEQKERNPLLYLDGMTRSFK